MLQSHERRFGDSAIRFASTLTLHDIAARCDRLTSIHVLWSIKFTSLKMTYYWLNRHAEHDDRALQLATLRRT